MFALGGMRGFCQHSKCINLERECMGGVVVSEKSIDFELSCGMRVLIYEPQYVGHNMAYVANIVPRLDALGCEVVLATSEQASKSEQFRNHLGASVESCEIIELGGYEDRGSTRGIRMTGPRNTWAMLNGLSKSLQAAKPEHLLIPFGNPTVSFLGMPSSISRYIRRHSIEAETLLLFGRYSYPHRGWKNALKENLALTLIDRGPWTRVHHILPHAYETMQSFSASLRGKANLLPDPIQVASPVPQAEARRKLKIPLDGRYAVLVGLLERRKGVLELLNARRAAKHLRHTDRVLLAGRVADELKPILATEYSDLIDAGQLIVLDRHLSNEELEATCFAANLVCTPYPNHRYSASIVIRAAAAGVPVLANAIGWMNDVVNRFGLGITCDTNNAEVFAEQLAHALESSSEYYPSEAAQRFVKFHTVENFTWQLTSRIAERLGQASGNAHALRWDTVINEETDTQGDAVRAAA